MRRVDGDKRDGAPIELAKPLKFDKLAYFVPILDYRIATSDTSVAMPFVITISDDADRQFRSLSAREQSILRAAILAKLQIEPRKTTASIKRLRPNPLAEYELRAANLRALYNVEEEEVIILVVGKKVGNRLIVEGVEFHAHQNNPVEPPENGSSGDVE